MRPDHRSIQDDSLEDDREDGSQGYGSFLFQSVQSLSCKWNLGVLLPNSGSGDFIPTIIGVVGESVEGRDTPVWVVVVLPRTNDV